MPSSSSSSPQLPFALPNVNNPLKMRFFAAVMLLVVGVAHARQVGEEREGRLLVVSML
jgi:hypothetical protein